MKKILITIALSTSFLFGANNLLTIIEQNSLSKMGLHTIKSYANPGNYMEIKEGIENNNFHNYSPYAFTEIESYENDLNVIVMVGEKTIQYGSIYSKGFGEKYNLNTLVNLIKKRELALALNTLDTFQQNNLIFIRNGVSNATKNDFEVLENYIKTQVSQERQFAYLKKLETIYSIVDYGNSIYNYTKPSLKLDPVNNIFFDIKSSLANSKILTSTRPNYKIKEIYNEDGSYTYIEDKENYNGEVSNSSSKKEYEMVNNLLVKRCLYPVIFSTYDAEGYSSKDFVYYDIKDVISLDLNKPLSISELHILTHDVCPTVKSEGNQWGKNKLKIVYPSIPSASGQKDLATSILKQSRNQGSNTNKIKSYYSGLQSHIGSKLKTLNDIGIVDGKIMHISYNLTESISNDKVVQGVVKMATTGTIFRDRFKVMSSEGIDYNIKNLPSAEVASYSEMTKDDSGNKYGTLYYFYNKKLQNGSPLYDDFHLYSSLTPNASKSSDFLKNKNNEKVEGAEVLWITRNDGTPIQPYLYYNSNELINLDDTSTDDQLIENTTSFLRSEVDIWGSTNVYPLNIKTIKTETFSINSKNDATRYFGPIFKSNIYLDKHVKIIEKEVSINCSIESCTEEQKTQTNPKKIVQEEVVSLYCGASFKNPDIDKFKFEVFQDIQNRFVEKPFGDIQLHYNKDIYEERIDIYNSNQKVPNYYQYVGLVNNKQECIDTLNSVNINEIKDVLIEEEALNFRFQLKSNVNEMVESVQEKYIGSEELVYSFTSDILNNKTIVYEDYSIIEETFVGDDSYETLSDDTFYNFFKEAEKIGLKDNNEGKILQILVPQN